MTATMTVVARRAGETIRRATAPRGVVPTAARPRVALYSHDGLGLGHIRRNLAIAHALAATASPDILLLTGAPGAVLSDRPEGCDIVSLPALTKDRDGGYAARHLSFGAAALTALRSGILTAALTSFRPDVLIVDKHPRGWNGELVAALTALRALGTRVVLGLRDVLDDAATTRREWQADDSASALEAWYDQVWVYGDRGVHDPLAELHVPARLRVMQWERDPEVRVVDVEAERRAARAARRRQAMLVFGALLAVLAGSAAGLVALITAGG